MVTVSTSEALKYAVLDPLIKFPIIYQHFYSFIPGFIAYLALTTIFQQIVFIIRCEQAKLRSIVENATLITLKSEKANLEREYNRLSMKVEELNKKNNCLAYEKYNLA